MPARESAPVLAAIAAALIVGALACAGAGSSAPPLAPPPDRATRATLVGPLCDGAVCRCRPGEDDAGRPAEGKKRFEVRLGPADHELWATIDGMVLYKDRERARDCFYVDLAPGVHPVRLRGAVDDTVDSTVSFQALVSEQGGGDDRSWWYDTFEFVCGAPGVCDRGALDEWKATLRGRRGKLDPCGSTKVNDVAWHSGHMRHGGGATDLEVAFELVVYGFRPEHPPDDPACAGGAPE